MFLFPMKMLSTILQRFQRENERKGKRNPRKAKHIFYNACWERREANLCQTVWLAARCFGYGSGIRVLLGGPGGTGISVWFRFGFPLQHSVKFHILLLCVLLFYFSSFFGSHCCMWHMANRCRTSSFESQQREKEDTLNQVPRKGYMYCVARQECVVRFDVQVVCYM